MNLIFKVSSQSVSFLYNKTCITYNKGQFSNRTVVFQLICCTEDSERLDFTEAIS